MMSPERNVQERKAHTHMVYGMYGITIHQGYKHKFNFHGKFTSKVWPEFFGNIFNKAQVTSSQSIYSFSFQAFTMLPSYEFVCNLYIRTYEWVCVCGCGCT